MLILDPKQYHYVQRALDRVTISNLFVRAVLNHDIKGIVYVNRIEDPNAFYVVHPYGMSLLFGELSESHFNAQVREYLINSDKQRNRFEWLQVFPAEWNGVLSELLGERLLRKGETALNGQVEEHTRVNFRFNQETYLRYKASMPSHSYTVMPTNEQLFAIMPGAVIPMAFWPNASHFMAKGMGYSLLIDGKLASTAFSAYVYDNQLEIGIETLAEFHGKGLAPIVCSALIDYCLLHNLEPVWSCRMENTASYKLAQKLGFEPSGYFPFYKLPV